MNVVSWLIVIALVIGAVRGYRLGLAGVILPSVGFAAGFLLGAHLAPDVMRFVGPPVAKFAVAVLAAFLLGSLGGAVGSFAARRLDGASDRLHLGRITRSLGAGLEAVMVLVFAWLLASGLTNVGTFGLGRQVQASPIVRALDAALPPPPDLVSRLQAIISPNGFPRVFLSTEPRAARVTPSQPVKATVVAAAERSVVQVIGSGCGGRVEGSGFVVAPGVVVTNAHVVAGVRGVSVLDSAGGHSATVVHFDPDEDLAVLEVSALQAPALATESGVVAPGAAGVVLGYPGGGPLREAGAVVLDEKIAVGQNIYARGTVSRAIYEVASDIEPGNSGGPLITAGGRVAGIVFAKSVSQNRVGYALVWSEVAAGVETASHHSAAVATGACAG